MEVVSSENNFLRDIISLERERELGQKYAVYSPNTLTLLHVGQYVIGTSGSNDLKNWYFRGLDHLRMYTSDLDIDWRVVLFTTTGVKSSPSCK